MNPEPATIIPAMRTTCVLLAGVALLAAGPAAQGQRSRASDGPVTVLKPARVWDGETMHEGWMVRVKGERIEAVGADAAVPGATVIDLAATTLTPGLVEGHSHILLHSYAET